MSRLILILPDQLSDSISSLDGFDSKRDTVVLLELKDELCKVNHHKKKLIFLLASMRCFASKLRCQGVRVLYVTIEDPDNTQSFEVELSKVYKKRHFSKLVVTQPSEFSMVERLNDLAASQGLDLQMREDERFLCSRKEFEVMHAGKTSLRMEYFYRRMRKKYRVLMDGRNPVGGHWNYDSFNRKFPKEVRLKISYLKNEPSRIIRQIADLVARIFSDNFGDSDDFDFAVTREGALKVLDHFIENHLPHFGDFQDAMVQKESQMFHSRVGLYLNNGLLLPLECIAAAEEAFYNGLSPLNSVEGFIRQILGWREFVRGVYWLKMPSYADANFLNARKGLPEFFWGAETKMNCVQQCVSETKSNAYAHHIQRLMVLGNFALLAGLNPKEVNEWFLAVYADAHEWVELPNVSGMALYADGGFLTSKPYAASGSYIKKMSNYCHSCDYDVSLKVGSGACPFNYLYWNFIEKNREKLSTNHRMSLAYKTYERMPKQKKEDIASDSQSFLTALR